MTLYKSSADAIASAKAQAGYTLDVTGDACQGDTVVFVRDRFSGSFRNAKYIGADVVQGVIIRDSYGRDKQQHTFTIELANGTTMRIKGRNLYKYITLAKPRDGRDEALAEKHERGNKARAMRDARS